jgi:PAS domain S-box-containing protein
VNGRTFDRTAPQGLWELLSVVPEPVFCCDGEGRVQWLNPALSELAGKRASELLGRPLMALLDPAEVRRLVGFYLRQQRRGVPVSRQDWTLSIAGGGRLALEVTVRLLERPGERAWFVGHARERRADLTELEELRRQALELSIRVDEARAASSLKGEFLDTISQEIRAPVSGVVGMTHLLLETSLDEYQRSLVEVVHRSSQALLTVINDTLDFLRMEACKLEIEALDFDLRATVDQVAESLAPLANERGIHLDCRVHHAVPSRLRGDPGRLRQVLISLALNCIQLRSSGSLAIIVEREHEDDDRVTLRFRITSRPGASSPSGRAASSARAASPVRSLYSFVGLGLSVARRLVELMGGDDGVEIRPDQDSSFWFRLPFQKQLESISAISRMPASLRGLRVLVADGADILRQPLVETLRAWGCEVDETGNGVEALESTRNAILAGRPYQLTLVDLQLPGMDGEELARALRTEGIDGETRRVLLSNVGRRGDASWARSLGYSAYLNRPLGWSELYRALQAVVRDEGSADSTGEAPLVTRHSLAEAQRGRVRVLLVEGDAVSKLVAESVLHRLGYLVDAVPDAAALFEAVEGQRYDLILMEVEMNDMDGCRAAAAIRAREQSGEHVLILGMSGNRRRSDRARCLAAGMDDHLSKPLDLAQLCETVERWVRRARGQEGPPTGDAPKAELEAAETPIEGVGSASRVIEIELAPHAAARAAAEPSGPPKPGSEAEAPGPPVRLEHLDETAMGLSDLRQQLVGAFLKDAPRRMARLREAVEADHVPRASLEARTLHGMCATLGAEPAAQVFAEIEQRGLRQQLSTVPPLLERADRELARIAEFLDSLDQGMSEAA